MCLGTWARAIETKRQHEFKNLHYINMDRRFNEWMSPWSPFVMKFTRVDLNIVGLIWIYFLCITNISGILWSNRAKDTKSACTKIASSNNMHRERDTHTHTGAGTVRRRESLLRQGGSSTVVGVLLSTRLSPFHCIISTSDTWQMRTATFMRSFIWI